MRPQPPILKPNVRTSESPKNKIKLEELRGIFNCYDYQSYREEQLQVSRNK